MKKSIYFLFAFTLFFAACKNDPPADQTTTTEQPEATTAIAPASIKLICQKAEDPNTEADAPHHEVFVQMGNSKTKIADILACDDIAVDMFAQYQIPENALTAVGGWWAGAGDYFYVAEEDGNYVVKQGGVAEEQEDNSYNYKTVATFAKDGNPLF